MLLDRSLGALRVAGEGLETIGRTARELLEGRGGGRGELYPFGSEKLPFDQMLHIYGQCIHGITVPQVIQRIGAVSVICASLEVRDDANVHAHLISPRGFASSPAAGAHQTFEELESLANDCARVCNRARARLSVEGRAKMDAVLAALVPHFEFDLDGEEGDGHNGGKEGQPSLEEDPALVKGHAIIKNLSSAGGRAGVSIVHCAFENPLPKLNHESRS